MTQEKRFALLAAQKSDKWRLDLPVGCVFVEAHANWFYALLQPAVDRTFQALGVLDRAGYGLGDQRRVTLRTVQAASIPGAAVAIVIVG